MENGSKGLNMPDITLCVNKTCPLRQNCGRFRAKPDRYWQSFAEFKPNDKGICEDFWPLQMFPYRLKDEKDGIQ